MLEELPRGEGETGLARPRHHLDREDRVAAQLEEVVADADAFGSIGLDRRRAGWVVAGLEEDDLPLFAADPRIEPVAELPRMALGDQVAEDYSITGLSLKRHPMALLRTLFDALAVQ